MSTVPATPQVPAVHRLPKTVDPQPAGVRDPTVTSLADLTGPPTTVTFSAPSGLGPCEDCVGIHAVAVATLTWPDPAEPTGHGEITVCRDCLGHQITGLIADLDLNTPIDVEVPAWTAADLAGEVRLADWMSTEPSGVPLRFLAVEDGGRYLADEVDHLRRLLNLRRAGMTLTLANAFLRRDPDLARSVETAVQRLRDAA